MDLRTSLGNIKAVNRLKGLVNLNKIQEGILGGAVDTVIGKTGALDDLNTPLDKVVELLDYEGVFDNIMGLFSGDYEGIWGILEPFMSLMPLDGLLDIKENVILEILIEQGVLDTILSMEDAKIDILFGKGLAILGEVGDVIMLEDAAVDLSLLESVKSGLRNILGNVVPAEKIMALEGIREFVPFILEEIRVISNIIGVVESKIQGAMGVILSNKQTLALIKFASKVGPAEQIWDKLTETCDNEQCMAEQIPVIKDILRPEYMGVIGAKADLKEILINPVTMVDAARLIIDTVVQIPPAFLRDLEHIWSDVLPGTVIGWFVAAASQIPIVGEGISSIPEDVSNLLNAKIGAKEVIANLISSESVSENILRDLVNGSQVIDIPELGSFIVMKGGFLTDKADSALTSMLKSGEFMSNSDYSSLINIEIFGGDNTLELGGSDQVFKVLSLENFPGGLSMFIGMLENTFSLLNAFDKVSGALDLASSLDFESFVETVIGILQGVKSAKLPGLVDRLMVF